MVAASTPKSGGSNAVGESSICCHMGSIDLLACDASRTTKVGAKEGLVYSVQLNTRDEPSANKLGGVLCVAQDREVICKHDYSGDSRGLVGCSWWESITVVIGWWLSNLVATQYHEMNLKL